MQAGMERLVETETHITYKVPEREGVYLLEPKQGSLYGQHDDNPLWLSKAVSGLVKDHTGTQIILDLSLVQHMDSAGLGDVVRSHTATDSEKGKLMLFGMSKRVHDKLSLTHLLTVFETYETLEQALEATK